MRKKPAQAITFHQFHQRLNGQTPSRPPQDGLLDRLFTALARRSGLTTIARKTLRARIARIEAASRAAGAEHIAHLYKLQNRVVDGGWTGLWTSVRVCARIIPLHA